MVRYVSFSLKGTLQKLSWKILSTTECSEMQVLRCVLNFDEVFP